jgi:pSer/pThr/pTyr-binding forkhead associated (FHA) protein
MSYLIWTSVDVRQGFSMLKETNTVGRSPKNTIDLFDGRISRLHAKITKTSMGCVLDDMSSNGTSVNGIRVQSVRLKDGDEICFGDAIYAIYRIRLDAIEVSNIFESRNDTFIGDRAAS